jgi:hypothetical protein
LQGLLISPHQFSCQGNCFLLQRPRREKRSGVSGKNIGR